MTLTDEQAEKVKENLFSQLKSLPKEQAETLREKIEEMNNDELEEFISQKQQQPGKKQCLFCQIAKGAVETIKVYEDDKVLAMMDIMPAKLGQVIVIPKQHFQFLFQLNDEIRDHLFDIVSLLEEIIVNVTKSNGINIHISQGQTAGQNVPHLSINLIPRKEKDNINFDWQRSQADKKELQKIADEMSERIRKDLDVKKKDAKPEMKIKEEKVEKAIEKEAEESETSMIFKHVKERMP